MANGIEIVGNKELIVTEIVSLIAGGILYKECLRLITQKYKFTSKTFDNYWNIANERVKQRQHDTQVTIIDNHTNSQLNYANGLIASREEVLIILTQIIRNSKNIENKPTVVISAISKLCDIEGYDAPKVIIEEAKASIIDSIACESSIDELERLILDAKI